MLNLLLFSFLPVATANHFIFAEIGKRSGAISYIHVVIPVNISGLKLQADHLTSLDLFKRNQRKRIPLVH
jgi:hypothetical protein